MNLFPATNGHAVYGPLDREDQPYRYLLTRRLDGAGPPFVIVMVNPSTATAESDDATIRRCIGFAKREGARSLVVANLFAYRSTGIRGLRAAADPVGNENNSHLRTIARSHGRIVCAWGPLAKMPPAFRDRPAFVADTMRRAGAELFALAVCQDGQPSHPLMLSNSCTPKPWSHP